MWGDQLHQGVDASSSTSCPNSSIQCKKTQHPLPGITQEIHKPICPPQPKPHKMTPQHLLSPQRGPLCCLERGGILPRLEWPTLDDTDDFCFCRFTVIITCSWTRCLPVPLVFSLWSEGRASVELA